MGFFPDMMIYAPMFVAMFWSIVLLLVSRSKNRAKHFLGIFMIGATIVYFSHAVFFTQHVDLYLWVDPLYVLATLSVYPLYYRYINLLTVGDNCSPKMIWLFVPSFVFSIATGLIYLLMDNPLDFIQCHLYNHPEYELQAGFLWRMQHYVFILSRIYLFFQVVWVLRNGLKLIRNYESRLKEFYSDLEDKSVDWAKWLILVFAVTAGMSTVANIVGRSFFAKNNMFLVIPVSVFSILIFLIGYLGFMQHHSVYELTIDEASGDHENPKPDAVMDNDAEELYPEIAYPTLKAQLVNLFENEQVYRKNDLKITTVSEMLNTNRTYVSRLINEEFLCSFSDFVNKYRVEEAREIIERNDDDRYTLEHIAEKVGYSSSGAFIRNFKKRYDVTPGSLRQKKID